VADAANPWLNAHSTFLSCCDIPSLLLLRFKVKNDVNSWQCPARARLDAYLMGPPGFEPRAIWTDVGHDYSPSRSDPSTRDAHPNARAYTRLARSRHSVGRRSP